MASHFGSSGVRGGGVLNCLFFDKEGFCVVGLKCIGMTARCLGGSPIESCEADRVALGTLSVLHRGALVVRISIGEP